MSHMNIKQLVDRWVADPGFREAMRQNAEATLRKEKIELSPAELKVLGGIDWNLSDAELTTRLSRQPLM